MTNADVQVLKARDHQTVEIRMKDGEVITGKVLFVSETEQDVIVDLITTTQPERYEKSDVQPTFQYRFADIDRVEVPSHSGHKPRNS